MAFLIKTSKRTYLGERTIAFLENYFCNMCEKPRLGEIENVAGVMEVKKESIHWWFVNAAAKIYKMQVNAW